MSASDFVAGEERREEEENPEGSSELDESVVATTGKRTRVPTCSRTRSSGRASGERRRIRKERKREE